MPMSRAGIPSKVTSTEGQEWSPRLTTGFDIRTFLFFRSAR